MSQVGNILLVEVDEANVALAGDALFLNLAADPEEALRRYEVLAEVLLAQLVGLKDCHVRFVVTPADGVDAVRFWLLPMLRGEVNVMTARNQVYQFLPEQQAPSITIDFAVDEGDLSGFGKVARMTFLCPECGSRWLNMAFLQCNEEQSVKGDGYLSVRMGEGDALEEVDFPALPVIENADDWDQALIGPLGGKIEKLYKKKC